MKKLLSLLLATIIILMSIQTDMLFTEVQAAEKTVDIWKGLSSAAGNGKFTKGDGTADNPYIIENGDQLYKMVYNFGTTDINLNGTPAYYKLGCDIYLNDISNYEAWGTADFDMSSLNNWAEYQDTFCHRSFLGNFNGDGHTIYGLYAHGYRVASFFPNVSRGAVIRNVNFKNSYVVNTSNIDAGDQEDSGQTTGEKVWYAGVFGAAGVVLSRADAAGDSDHNTVDFTINNCSVTDAYVEAKYFTSSFVAAANSCQPYIANCMTAGITLNSTSADNGVEGAILNMPYGSTNPTANMENIIAVGYPIYGTGRDEMWSGKKTPAVSHTYTFKNVYSTVSNKYTINHSSYGNLSFTDSEVNFVSASSLIGVNAESTIPGFDWAYTWRTVEGGYPMPMREYVVPTGDEYYQNGGPKYSTDRWDGAASTHFAAGDGSLEDPYLIANCEEFYRMVTIPESDKYYKIADGVTDLYFNDTEGKSYSTLMLYFSLGIGDNYAYDESKCFSGSFDGNGVVFHGIRSAGSNYAGLFSQVGTATLRNFTIKYSFFKTSSSSAKGAAAVVGNVRDNSTVDLRNIAIIDCDINTKTNAAGFIGNAGAESNVYIENCIISGGKVPSGGNPTNYSAFLANGTNSSLTVKNSISLGVYPASAAAVSYNGKYLGVYTDTAAPSTTVGDATNTINVVQKSALQGEQAKATCKEFNWTYSWDVTNSIPMPKNEQNNNGVAGEAWSGKIAQSFAGGNGTKNNPYQINTAEMLARMLIYGRGSNYYKLTADIHINDTTKENWQNGALEWFTSKDVSAFEGCLDGNGFTVYGLYGVADSQNEYAALIPILGTESQIKTLKIDNCYLTGSQGAYLGGIAGVLEDNAHIASSIYACTVGDNVAFYGEANVGGIIAAVGFSRVIIENCVFRGKINTSGDSYGICGDVIGKLEVNECISLNYAPFASDDKINARNIYTDNQVVQSGVIVLPIDNMKGINARKYMTALDFSSLWRLSTTDIPIPTGNTRTYNGVKGQVWTGKIASSFASGGGTKNNPYIIETAEQLALLITKAGNYSEKYFKLACDIYLNDVNGELWQSKSGALNWITSADAGYFESYLDGNGYAVFGMFYSFKETPKNTYMGLIPRFSGSAEVKNLGVSQAYIKSQANDNTIYAGGIFGMGSAFYDFYGQKISVSETQGDVFLIPGQTVPTKLPSITNCFVDHTCYIEAYNAGGIGCPGGAAIVIRDCYVTATINGATDSSHGGLIGPNWADCSRVYNSVSFTQNDMKSIVGNHQWIDSIASICTYTENVYYYGNKHIFGTTRIKRPQWRIGEEAKANMSELDWENTWRIESDGTPVLRVFDKEERSAEMFSDKSFVIPEVKVTFETGVDGLVVEELIGKAYEKIDLPVPQRQGYKFVAWHGFEDLTYEYDYDYFLPRDITLYAQWREVSITEDFEKYPYTEWDCDTSVWRYNAPQNAVEYNSDYVRSGQKSIQLMVSGDDAETLLVNYRKTLTAGQRYTISFWVAGQNSNIRSQFALAHKMYPDYMAADKLIEPIISKGETVGKWTKYEYSFEAQTPWVAIKVLDGAGLYFDDVVISIDGELVSLAETSTDVYEAEFYGSTFEGAVLSNGVNTVGEYAFAYNDFITDIYISESVTQIGEYAFYGCDHLTDVWYAGSEEELNNIYISENNKPLIDAIWHFDSCSIGQEHTYDSDNDADCNACGEVRYEVLLGDVNGDGKINGRDYAIVLQYINGWDVEMNALSADVNSDGKINGRDYAIILQYINGWDVKING